MGETVMIHRASMFPALVLMQAALPAPAAAQGCEPGKCIRIGSYNIKFFANNGPANTSAEIDQLANRIADEASLDVVALEEINKGGVEWMGPEGLRAKLNGRGYEVAIEGSIGGEDPKRPQFIVLLYRSKAVSLVAGSTGEIGIPTTFNGGGTCIYNGLRPPVVARFKAAGGAFEFRVIGVHMKSQLKVGTDEKCDDRIRAFQAEQILTYIAEMKKDEKQPQAIVVGDFNAEFTAPEYGDFGKAGFGSMIQGNCSTASIDQCSYVQSPHESLIDHVVVHSSLTQAVQGSGTIAKVRDLSKYVKSQSDHVPVWASFRVDAK
jgi:endonuclease/exonuclease/phosphatase family metal-dependent hydrolase